MLFRQVHLHGIKAGTITVAFRRWKKPAAKKGSLLKTAIGLVEIVDVVTIQEHEITEGDARNAGFENQDELLSSLRSNGGTLFKIQVRYHSEDPRLDLRETPLTDELYAKLSQKLSRLDSYGSQWTTQVLKVIQENPHRRAIELATLLGYEKDWLKLNIRKLKNLGLTISHEIGYELSSLGKSYLDRNNS